METKAKLVGALLLSLTFALAGAPPAAAASASCSGDPCADVGCDADGAAAAAYGSEYAHAAAEAGRPDAETKPSGGAAKASSTGPGAMAEAEAKKDWSPRETGAACSYASGFAGDALHRAEELVELVGEVDIIFTPRSSGFSIGCVADDRITQTQGFLGRLYVDPSGGLVLFDAARGEGLALDGPALRFNGASLDAAAPLDLAGLTATNVRVSLDFVNDANVQTCSADLIF